MDRRSFKKKRKTAQRFAARKSKPPIVKKKSSPATSASSDGGVRHDEDSQPSTSTHGASSASSDETVLCAVGGNIPEASRERAAAVQESLRVVSATARKMSLMDQGDESDIEAEDEDEFLLVQCAALNGQFGGALCPQCKEPGLKMKHGTKHGLAVKMVLTCTTCGVDAKNAASGKANKKKMRERESFEIGYRPRRSKQGKKAALMTNAVSQREHVSSRRTALSTWMFSLSDLAVAAAAIAEETSSFSAPSLRSHDSCEDDEEEVSLVASLGNKGLVVDIGSYVTVEDVPTCREDTLDTLIDEVLEVPSDVTSEDDEDASVGPAPVANDAADLYISSLRNYFEQHEGTEVFLRSLGDMASFVAARRCAQQRQTSIMDWIKPSKST
ncbi:hypothetical protein HPB52_005609 [Rhipicephalus sanguineus]|uniref:Uncharacterized protein n=1 Tax=Rhipicephalus sanguineus TaxID=34632 RepID=A0A9D4SS25_RHISA|nr:hypothetical protein HPB52_005609 [Rhipicephalus sanguineus]